MGEVADGRGVGPTDADGKDDAVLLGAAVADGDAVPDVTSPAVIEGAWIGVVAQPAMSITDTSACNAHIPLDIHAST